MDGKFVLGEEKADEVVGGEWAWFQSDLSHTPSLFSLQAFASVVDLVQFHKREPLVLKSGGKTTLRYECPH